MDPDDPWNRAAADRDATKLEKEGHALLGPVIGAEAEFGRHEGTLGAITTYEAVNHDVLAGDDAGMWRFRPAGSDAEHLILHRTEGVAWQRELAAATGGHATRGRHQGSAALCDRPRGPTRVQT